jgi:hypothetical protein
MNATSPTSTGFDLVRLTKSKETVDFSPNTIRAYSREGLNLYRKGKAVFFSKAELAAFLTKGGLR